MDLATYMTAHDLDDAQLGVRIGRSRSRVSRYRRGLEPIPADAVKLLVELSGGRMTANDLLGIKPLRKSFRRPGRRRLHEAAE
jgi:hypothetical protein